MKFRMALAVHTVAIFLSASLLFSVQPLFARMVLPLLGGAPAVWNSCLFFFQGVLLAGYLYVHVTSVFLTARRQLILHAADRYDRGERCDMEAGMAKLFASEAAMEVALSAVRIHGGYGYSTEFDVERYFRDAPLMIVGEGTNEIQRNVVAAQLVKRGGLDRG